MYSYTSNNLNKGLSGRAAILNGSILIIVVNILVKSSRYS